MRSRHGYLRGTGTRMEPADVYLELETERDDELIKVVDLVCNQGPCCEQRASTLSVQRPIH